MIVMKHFKKAANHKRVIQACNLSKEDAEVEGSQIQGHPRIERSCFIRTTTRKKIGMITLYKKKAQCLPDNNNVIFTAKHMLPL